MHISSSPNDAAGGEMRALPLRKIRHLGEGVDAFLVKPAQDLLRAKGRPAEWSDERGHPAFGQRRGD